MVNGPRSSKAPHEIIVELARADDAGDPFAFRFGEQSYLLRREGGIFDSASFAWDHEVLSDLEALMRATPDREAMARLGDRLRGFLADAGFSELEDELAAELDADEPVRITVRSAAAELYALPWELTTIGSSGRHLGEHPTCLVRYEWPDPASEDAPAVVAPEGGRILFAWSAAGGGVPAEAHLTAIAGACKAAHHPFDAVRDTVANASRVSLREALSTGETVAVLHLLCHGGAATASADSYGLLLDGEGSEADLVDAAALRQLLSPQRKTLRLVVLSACHGGHPGALGNHLGSVAQALHRAGFPAIVASRYPLSTAGSCLLAESLYERLLPGLASLEDAFLTTRSAAGALGRGIDWASLQLFTRGPSGEDHRPFTFRPYRGLSPFQPGDARFFFGREPDVERLLSALSETSRLLTVVGAPGAGKSSVVMAGLVPRLDAGALGDGKTRWRILRPGRHPCRSLAEAMASIEAEIGAERTEVSKFEVELLKSPEALARFAQTVVERSPETKRVVWVVDQLEEVFTVTETDGEQVAFVENLLYATAVPGAPSYAVLTLRADFLAQCLDLRELAERVRASMEILLPMAEAELREAIVRPAEIVGLHFEEGLVDALIEALREGEPQVPSRADVEGGRVSGAVRRLSAGNLPLLEFALEELWSRRQGSLLGWDAWRSVGGVRGSVARRADEVLAQHSAEEQRLVPQLFSRLVQLGEGTADTRRRAARSELLAVGSDKVGKVLDRWLAARLLTAEGDDVGLAHEALIREWRVLRRWIAENREALRMLGELRAAAERWRVSDKSSDELWRGGRLGRAVELVAARDLTLSATEASFLGASEEAERAAAEAQEAQHKRELAVAQDLAISRKKAARWLWLGMAVLLMASVAALIGMQAVQAAKMRAVIADQEAVRARENEAREGEVARLQAVRASDANRIETARTLLAKDPTSALLVLREIGRPEDNTTWIPIAAEALFWPTSAVILRNRRPLRWASFSPDGTRVLGFGDDGVAQVFSADGGAPVAVQAEQRLATASWSPDGKTILAMGDDGKARLWPAVGSGAATALGEQALHALRFSPDGQKLVGVGRDGRTWVWDARGNGKPTLLPTESNVGWAALSPDASQVLTLSDDGQVRLQTSDGRTTPRVLRKAGGVQITAFSPDGSRVLTAGEDGVLRVFRTEVDEDPVVLKGHKGAVLAAVWSPDGSRIAAGGADGVVRIFSADGGASRALGAPTAEPRALFDITWSPEGSRLLTFTEGAPPSLWTTAGDAPPVTLPCGCRFPLGGAFSPDGKRIVTISEDQPPMLWTAEGGGAPLVLRGHAEAGAVATAVWSPKGDRLLTASSDGTARIWPTLGMGAVVHHEHPGQVRTLVLDPAGKQALSGLDNGSLELFPIDGQGAATHFEGHTAAVLSAVFSPDGKRIVTGSADHTARVWNVATPQTSVVLRGHDDEVWAVALDPKEGKVATASKDGTVRLWTADGSSSIALRHKGPVVAVAFAPGGAALVTASKDGTARLWDGNGKEIAVLRHANALVAASWSADGKTVLTASTDQTARLWSATGLPERALQHGEALRSAAFTPDGQRILTTTADNTVHLWPLRGGEQPLSLVGSSAVVSPDGKRLLTVSRASKTVSLWWSDGGGLPLMLEAPAGVVGTALFGAGGQRVVASSDDGVVRVWPVTSALVREAMNVATRACLGAEDRTKLLGETTDNARIAEADCLRQSAASR